MQALAFAMIEERCDGILYRLENPLVFSLQFDCLFACPRRVARAEGLSLHAFPVFVAICPERAVAFQEAAAFRLMRA